MAERVLMKGNEAIAEAAIRAGCRHYFGYPITPQTEIAAYMAKKMPKIGGVFLQAESEVASINMVYGAAAAGMRVMTSSSSPGISLKAEGLSYIAGSDIPALVVNVQRGGPGLGGIQPSQSDYFQATKGGGHGDYRMIVLAPASVQEMASLTVKGFNLADKYLMTAMILADGTIGQMMEPISFEDVIVEEYDKPWALTGTEGKRKHNIVNSLYLKTSELEEKNFERFERYALVEKNEAMWEEYMMEDADVCVVAFGIAARVAKNAVAAARAEGIKAGLIRPITLWPFPKDVLRAAADKVKGFISVELNMGQMIEDVRLYTESKKPVALCNRAGGMIPSPDEVLASIRKAEKGEFLEMAVVFEKPKSLTDVPFHYCPGCPHGIIHRLVAEAIDELQIEGKTIGVAPVGCAVMAYDYFACDMIEAAHGRAPAVATGIKRCRPDNVVFTYQGDGDLASIGMAETVHAAARNENITIIFVNNAIYGMTGGQMAPTSLPGQVTQTSPYGRDVNHCGWPIKVCEMLSTLDGPEYVARVAANNVKNVKEAKKAIKKAFQNQIEGKGFSLVEVVSACPTNWGMTPKKALEWVESDMIPYYPLGVYKDRSAAKEEQ